MPFVIPKQNPSAIPIPHAKSNISRKGIPSFSNTWPKTHGNENLTLPLLNIPPILPIFDGYNTSPKVDVGQVKTMHVEIVEEQKIKDREPRG